MENNASTGPPPHIDFPSVHQPMGAVTIQSAVLGRLVVIRWASQPNQADIAAFDQAVATARQSLSGPIIHLALISEGIEMPPSSIQRCHGALRAVLQCLEDREHHSLEIRYCDVTPA